MITHDICVFTFISLCFGQTNQTVFCNSFRLLIYFTVLSEDTEDSLIRTLLCEKDSPLLP